MLTRLRIKNFKAWRDTGDIRLAPLTVLFGGNSAGKSSLGHLLLALKQTAASTDRRRALHTGDDTSLIDLGTFVDSLHGRKRDAQLEFTLGWKLPEALSFENPFVRGESFSGTHLQLSATLSATEKGQPFTREFRYELGDGAATTLSAALHAEGDRPPTLKTSPWKLVHADGRKWPLEPAEKFYRISDRSLARYKNSDFLADLALEAERALAGLSYLGPLREHPHRTYAWSGNTPESVGMKGEFAIACLLAADAADRSLNRGPRKQLKGFAEFIADWLVDLGVIESFEVRPTAPGRKDYEVRVKTLGGLAEVALPDVGFGISQVLPALVQAFYCPPHSTVWMEQPEIHLHPQVQAELADVFISAIRANEAGSPRQVQLIIETHSEHFLHRLQRRIAEETLSPDDVAVYFAKAGRRGAELEELKVDAFGEIINWPDNFFGDEMTEVVARTEAAAKRREKGSR